MVEEAGLYLKDIFCNTAVIGKILREGKQSFSLSFSKAIIPPPKLLLIDLHRTESGLIAGVTLDHRHLQPVRVLREVEHQSRHQDLLRLEA